jgi:hypothetical protein
MNINKKYAVFGVAAVIAVAGVIYFGTSANQQASVANVADKLAGPSTPTDDPVTPSAPTTTPIMTEFEWRRLCRDRQPHIQVLSPNGGEIYNVGQQAVVKWRSCNGNSDDTARIWMEQIIGTDIRSTFITNAPEQPGSYTISRLPYTIGQTPITFGKNFKFKVEYLTNIGTTANVLATDESDNLFTINAPDPWVTLCADNKPHVQVLSPNGGEQYYAGSQITMKWKTCNIPASKKVTLILNDTVHSMGGDLAVRTANDGTELVTLPTTATWNPFHSGKFYKARASFATYDGIDPRQLSDESDALFSIKDNTVQVDVCWNISGIQTTVPAGMVTDGSGNCVPGGTTNPSPNGSSLMVTGFSAPKPTLTVNTDGAVISALYRIQLKVSATGSDFYIPRSAGFIRGTNTTNPPSLNSPQNGISFGILDAANTYVDGATAGNIATPASEISSSVSLVSGGIIDPSGRIRVSEGETVTLDLSVNISEGVIPQDVVGQYKIGALSVNGAETSNGVIINYNTTPISNYQTPFNNPAFQ